MRLQKIGFEWPLRAVATIALCLSVGEPTLAQSSGDEFPDEISPSDVYATLDLLNRSVDILLESRGIGLPDLPRSLESGLGPFHVYQLQLACIERLHTLQREADLRPIPIVVSSPMKYTPADVMKLTEIMLVEVRMMAFASKMRELPKDLNEFSGKTPTDVAQQSLALFTKLGALGGGKKISPNEVFAQMVRTVADAESILKQIDPACRYLIDAPVSKPGMKPVDVFTQCLNVRREINKLRESLKLSTTPVPRISAGQQLQPMDVFVQTQIIIAELNLLKLDTDTVSSTPLAIPVEGKTPTDAHQHAVLLQYLIPQVRSLRGMMVQLKGR